MGATTSEGVGPGTAEGPLRGYDLTNLTKVIGQTTGTTIIEVDGLKYLLIGSGGGGGDFSGILCPDEGNERGELAVDLQCCRENANQVASGDFSVITGGCNNRASGDFSAVSGGHSNTAAGYVSHAEGRFTRAEGSASHAEGYSSTASGDYSHAEGQVAYAYGRGSHAEGRFTRAEGSASHAEGRGTVAEASNSHAEGRDTTAEGSCSHAEGYETTAEGHYSHAEGYETIAEGDYSHAEGRDAISVGEASHAEGDDTQAIGDFSHAEGRDSKSVGESSHAEGTDSTAAGYASHAEGYFTLGVGNSSHAEGFSCMAFGDNAHVESNSVIVNEYGYTFHSASGHSAHTEGQVNVAGNQIRLGTFTGDTMVVTAGYGNDGDFTSEFSVGNEVRIFVTYGYGEFDQRPINAEIVGSNYSDGQTTVQVDADLGNAFAFVVDPAIGEAAHVEGRYNHAQGNWSHAGGHFSHARLTGMFARGNMAFAATSRGSAQHTMTTLGRIGVDNTPRELTLDKNDPTAENRFTVPVDTTLMCFARIAARNHDGTEQAAFIRYFLISNEADVTAMIGTAETIGTDKGTNAGVPPVGWTVDITADDTNDSITINVEGSAAWVCLLETIEIRFDAV